MNKELTGALKRLGIKSGKSMQGGVFTVLRTVLNVYQEQKDSVSFGDIFEALKDEGNFKVSKAWIHRILKNLLEMGFIRLEIPYTSRYRYIANIETVASGMEKMKIESIENLETQIENLEEELTGLKNLETATISQDFVEYLTGKPQVLHSRFIQGMEELHRVLLKNIHGHAGPGDIIRSTMSFGGPWWSEKLFSERASKYIESAIKGVDVRYLIDAKNFQSEQAPQELRADVVGAMISKLVDLKKQGLKFEIRLYHGGSMYNHQSLNDECMALIVTEAPPTSMFVTRDFNKPLIDSVIHEFDERWEKSVPMIGAKPEELMKLGLADTQYFKGIIQKIQENQDSK